MKKKHFFVKCPTILEKKNCLCTHKMQLYQVTVLGTDPVLEIGPILRHLNSRNFLIPNPRQLIGPSHFKGIFMDFDFPTK